MQGNGMDILSYHGQQASMATPVGTDLSADALAPRSNALSNCLSYYHGGISRRLDSHGS